MKKILGGATLALLVAAPLAAAPLVVVTDGWFRALPGRLPAGGYFTLHNAMTKTITLNGASSTGCEMLMLHLSQSMSGMSSMSDVASIDVPPGSTLKFAPGGYHLMCMNPAPAIKPGAKVTVVLGFADGTKIPVLFAVRAANGK